MNLSGAIVGAVSVILIGTSACQDSLRETPTSLQPRFMKNGSGNGIKVRAVDPDTAFQGETLDILITGSGFDPESDVRFEVDGQPAGEIVTQSTGFINERKLSARIAVAEAARLTKYDVVVETLSRGKKGIGLELLEVKAKGNESHPVETTLVATGSATVGAVLPDLLGASYTTDEVDVSTQVTTAAGALRLAVDIGRKNPRPDRRVCLALRKADGNFVVMDGTAWDGNGDSCVDADFVGGLLLPDGRQGGLLGMVEGESDRGRARFLWNFEGGKGKSDDRSRWLRFGTTCERVNDAWVLTDESERVTFTRTQTGWEVRPNDPVAYLCKNTSAGLVPASEADADGKVRVELAIDAREL